MPRILTVTVNTAIDHCLEIDQLSPGDTLVAKNGIEYAAGKGVNVARAVESLQLPIIALGFVGHQSRHMFDALRSELLQTDFTVVEGKTRSNITLADTSKHQETHIRTSGFSVALDDCNRLLEKLEEYIKPDDLVVLSGSLPPGAPDNLYPTLIELCHNKGALSFLDTSGQSLNQGLLARPYLIKPNQKELEQIMGRTLSDEKAIVTAARGIISQGIPWVVVSRGKQGAIVVADKLALAAEVECVSEKIISAIGCGDALVAGLAVAMLSKNPLLDVIKFGLSCATANLFSNEPGRFDPLLAKKFQRHIIIRSL